VRIVYGIPQLRLFRQPSPELGPPVDSKSQDELMKLWEIIENHFSDVYF